MGFIMEGLDAESYDRTYGDRELVRRVVEFFRPRARTMLLISGMVVLNSLMDSALPLLIATGLDRLTDNDGGIDRAVWLVVIAILVAGAFSWGFNYIRQSLTARVVGDVVLRLRLDAFKAVMERDLSFYDENPSGKIVSRVTSDSEDFANTVTLSLNLVSQILLVVLVTAVLFARDVRLALLAITIAPVVVAMALGFRKIARESTRRAQRALATVNTTVQETMRGIAVAKNFRQEETIYGEFGEVNDTAYRVTVRQGIVFSSIFPLLFTVSGVGTVLLVYVGGRSVLSGDVSAGDWYLFLQAIALFWMPLTSIASFWSQFQLGLSAAERAFALIDATPRVVQHDRRHPGAVQGRIEFRDVDFGYNDEHLVLRDFDLTIAAGETVALVGHTGAGKSTLGKLVARFYEFQDGQILIDNRDIRSFDLEPYRQRLGVVPQVPFLFAGTVADNIRYPRPDATDADVEQAARRIAGGDWIEALPNGLQTEVGEQGRGLSMGQRQLVALARILVQDAAIVILDEATASVDPLTEEFIQEGLDEVLFGRTAIVIAHRLVTIRHADRIIVLRHGQIVEEGNHDALMLRGGEYAGLYNTYFRHQSPDYRPGEGFVPVLAGAD
ncbi:MAG: ABC transporter ATP-binding protein [Thermomicrobiales bacterium]